MATRKVIVDVGGRHSPLNAGEDTIDIHSVPIASAVGNQLSEHNGGLAVFGYYEATSGKEATLDNSPGNPLSTGYIEFRKGDGVERVNTLTTDFINFRVLGRRLSATVRKLLGKTVEEQYTLTVDLPVPTVLDLNVADGVKRKLLWCSYKKTWEYWLTGTFQAQTTITLPSIPATPYSFGPNPVLVTASGELGNVTVTNKTDTSLRLTVQNPGPGTVKLEGWL